jgi:glutathione S-transferase
MDFELISFALCPFVQRTAITLLHKNVPFRTTYIDLASPPGWFREISPLGKVPLLRVGETVLFESSVINEYVDEVTPPSLLPRDPLARARERACVEAASELLLKQYEGLFHQDRAAAEQRFESMGEILFHVERTLGKGPFFRGGEFSLVDSAFAPFFTRLALVPFFRRTGLLDDLPRVRRWSAALTSLPEVTGSVRADFEEQYLASLRDQGSRFAA